MRHSVNRNVSHTSFFICKKTFSEGEGKCKARPRTGYEDPDGEQRYSSTLSSTSVPEAGGW